MIHPLPDNVYNLPDSIDDPALVEMYNVIVHNLKEEASTLPMNTVQQLLLERIAYNYILLRWKENRDGWTHERNQKEFHTFWLSMTAEFNRNLRAAKADELVMAIKDKMMIAVKNALETVPSDVRSPFMNALADGFEEAGL